MAYKSKEDVKKALKIYSGAIEASCRECSYNNIEIEENTKYDCYDQVMIDAAEYLSEE